MVIIDNSVLSFVFQFNNGIPILPFYDNKKDIEFTSLVKYLKHLSTFDDIGQENKKLIPLDFYKKKANNENFEMDKAEQNVGSEKEETQEAEPEAPASSEEIKLMPSELEKHNGMLNIQLIKIEEYKEEQSEKKEEVEEDDKDEEVIQHESNLEDEIPEEPETNQENKNIFDYSVNASIQNQNTDRNLTDRNKTSDINLTSDDDSSIKKTPIKPKQLEIPIENQKTANNSNKTLELNKSASASTKPSITFVNNPVKNNYFDSIKVHVKLLDALEDEENSLMSNSFSESKSFSNSYCSNKSYSNEGSLNYSQSSCEKNIIIKTGQKKNHNVDIRYINHNYNNKYYKNNTGMIYLKKGFFENSDDLS